MSSPAAGSWLKRVLFVGATLQLLLIGYLASPEASGTNRSGTLSAGRLTVIHDGRWTRDGSRDVLAGVALSDGGSLVHEDGSRAEIGRLADAGGEPPLSGLFSDGVPEPARVEFGEHTAVAYRSEGPPETFLYLFALTSGQRLVIACRAATEDDVCTPLAASAAVDGTTDAGPNPALAAAMRAAIEAVSERAAENQAPLRARQSARRADGARAMAEAYTALARTTSALARRDDHASDRAALFPIVAAAQRVAAGFRSLEAAAEQTDRAAFRRTLAQLRASGARLDAAVLGLRELGYEVGR